MKIRRQRERLSETKARLDELLNGIQKRDGRMKPDEKRQADEITAQLQAEGLLLDQLVEQEKRDLFFAASTGGPPCDPINPIRTAPAPGSYDQVETMGPDGRRAVVPLLKRDQTLAALPMGPEDRLPDGIKRGDLSLGRLIRGMVTGDWAGAEAEKRSTQQVSVGSLGGFAVPTPLALDVIDLARNMAQVVKAGARTVPMEHTTLDVLRQIGDPTAFWRGENQAITESNAEFSLVRLKAEVLAALVRLSVEVVEDAPNFSSVIQRAISSALALELDRALLLGDGLGKPLGVFSTPGVGEIDMGPNGAALTSYDPFSQAVEAIQTANGIATAAIYNARTSGALDRLKSAVDAQPLIPPQSFQNLTRLVSNQVPNDQTHGSATNGSAAFVGGFENVWLGLRKSLVIEIFRSGDDDSVKNLQVLIRAYLRADSAVVRPDHLCRITGIIPA
jgi:HK97 family phage major capsid protein